MNILGLERQLQLKTLTVIKVENDMKLNYLRDVSILARLNISSGEQ